MSKTKEMENKRAGTKMHGDAWGGGRERERESEKSTVLYYYTETVVCLLSVGWP